jgi:AbrB family looped-hinge helix DNA binding protein
MKAVVSTNGQIVLPSELRRQDRIRPGEQFDIKRIKSGWYLLKKQADSSQVGLVDWLLVCPERDWFQPLSSGSTNAIATIMNNSF